MSLPGLLGGVLHKPWVSPGPTIDRLVLSAVAPFDRMRHRARVRVAIGPIGSGKSTGIMGGTIVNAMQQPKWPDGVRRYVLMILRDDYRKLWTQFLPFWFDWWPKDAQHISFEGSLNNPVDTTIFMQTPFGPLDYIVKMRALGQLHTDEEIDAFYRGTPFTDLWMEEGDLQPEPAYRKGITRLGRFPQRSIDGKGAVTPTLWLGSNQFMIGSWPYRIKMTGEWKPDIELFEQPGARSPAAENKHNLREGYYDDIIEKSDARTIRRQVDNEHVLPMAGQPVYPDFADLVHCKPVEPDPQLPLMIGFDAGLDPAAAIGQRTPLRQLRYLDEVPSEHGTGAARFGREVNKMLALPRYRPWRDRRKDIVCTVDPSAAWGADTQEGEKNWIMKVEAATGLVIRSAYTNNPGERRAPIKEALTRMAGGQPGLIVSPRCRMIREGLGGMHHFAKIMNGSDAYSEKPKKGPHSHPVEAAEYMAMDDEERGVQAGTQQGQTKRRRQTHAVTDDNPNGAYAET